MLVQNEGPASSTLARRVAGESAGHVDTRLVNHACQSTSSPPAASPGQQRRDSLAGILRVRSVAPGGQQLWVDVPPHG